MANCNYCGTYILFGGVRSQTGEQYCNNTCLGTGSLLAIADQIPPDVLDQHIQATAAGECPQCQGPGPIDVYVSYRIWSALLLTQWSSHPAVCCRSCATKNNLQGLVFSAALGWWGVPWGLLGTPIQVARNIAGLASGTKQQPSAELAKMIKISLAGHLLENARRDMESSP